METKILTSNKKLIRRLNPTPNQNGRSWNIRVKSDNFNELVHQDSAN